jgi:hypothetical protein
MKTEASIDWTLCGILIDWSYENENAFDSIRVNGEFDSNEIDETDESDLQFEKHDGQRISTFLGIIIDRSDEFEWGSGETKESVITRLRNKNEHS